MSQKSKEKKGQKESASPIPPEYAQLAEDYWQLLGNKPSEHKASHQSKRNWAATPNRDFKQFSFYEEDCPTGVLYHMA